MLTVVVGAAFAAKSWWIDREIERRESDGEIGLVHLSYSGVYGAIVPGAESVYRDARVSDSGAARYAAYVLRLAVGEAARRELSGYVAYDSPRLAVQAAQELGGAPGRRSDRDRTGSAQALPAARRAGVDRGAASGGR